MFIFSGKSYTTRRALFVTLSLVTLGTFQGFTVLQVYAKPLFDEAVPDMSSTVCSIIQALITLAVALMSGTLSDLAGRRVRLFVFILAWYIPIFLAKVGIYGIYFRRRQCH